MPASSAVSAQQPEASSGGRWTVLQRWAVRAALFYFALDALPDLLLRFPGGASVLKSVYWKVWNAILPWFGRYILHVQNPSTLPLPTAPVLLGDFAGGYALMLLFLLLGLAVATIWTLAERRRGDDASLHYWLRVYVRYALAFSMLGYGLGKVLLLQFQPLGLLDLLTPVGMLEPRGLLWAFMGFSRSYQLFTGLVECAGIALLFWRRTTLLGSLLLIGALGNVLMIDVGYGMTVRRIALRLLLMAVFLTVPDLGRMADFFVRHTPATAGDTKGPVWKSGWMRWCALGVKAAVILYVVGSQLSTDLHDPRRVSAARPALYGVYQVHRFLRNGAANDARAWQWVAVEERGMAVQLAGVNWARLATTFDDAKQSITISSGPRRKDSLTYSRSDPDDVLLKGVLESVPTEILLHRVAEPRFTLNDPAAMHWPKIW